VDLHVTFHGILIILFLEMKVFANWNYTLAPYHFQRITSFKKETVSAEKLETPITGLKEDLDTELVNQTQCTLVRRTPHVGNHCFKRFVEN